MCATLCVLVWTTISVGVGEQQEVCVPLCVYWYMVWTTISVRVARGGGVCNSSSVVIVCYCESLKEALKVPCQIKSTHSIQYLLPQEALTWCGGRHLA